MAARVLRFILWCMATATFRIRIEGAENIPRAGGALLVSNHVSYADAIMVGYPTRRIVRFLLWKPIYDLPFFTHFFRGLGAIPISEDSPKTTVRALRSARAELERGELVAIFAEGAISRDGAVAPFQRGYERILHGIDVPVIPMNVSGLYGHPLSRRGGAPFKSWQKLWRPLVTVRIGSPVYERIPPEELRQMVAKLGEPTGGSPLKGG